MPIPAKPGVVVGYAAAATTQDVSDAVAAAKAAYPAWAALSPQQRAEKMLAALAGIAENRDDDAAILSQENGKIRFEGWVDSLVLELRWKLALSHADEVNAAKVLPPIHGAIPVETTVAYQPLGVVTIIVPFNWPVAILGAALPHALLAGNTVIVKPPLTAPLATARIVQRIAEQLPPGVLNVITGADANMTRADPQSRRGQGLLHRLGQRRQEDDGTGLAEPHPRHPGTRRQRCGHRTEGRDPRRRAPGSSVRRHLRHHRPDLHERQAPVRAQVACR